MPYRCPPGPFERASLIAHYLKTQKPRSKVLILDSNESFPKQELFQDAWEVLYPGMIEWVPGSGGGQVTGVRPRNRIVIADGKRHRGDVVNVIPPERAGSIAAEAGVTDESGWCPVEPRGLQSEIEGRIHVIGDSALTGMPKSGVIANTEAKVCAMAVTSLLRGEQLTDAVYLNACYSLLAPDYAISIAMLYKADEEGIRLVEDSVGTSPRQASFDYRAEEADDLRGWYASITADSFS